MPEHQPRFLFVADARHDRPGARQFDAPSQLDVRPSSGAVTLRAAKSSDVDALLELINGYAARGLLLWRSEASLRARLADFVVVARETRARRQALAAWDQWSDVVAVDPVRRQAERLVSTHPLRAVDALQLGAALVACSLDPSGLPLVTLDDRLAAAAEREGFTVLGA